MILMYGPTIRKLMRDKGITQKKLGSLIGIPQPTISHYLNDYAEIPASRLAAIANALRVSIYEITGGEPPPNHAALIERIKDMPLDQILEALKAKGFSEKTLEFVRALHGIQLEQWQIDIIMAALKGGGKKENQ